MKNRFKSNKFSLSLEVVVFVAFTLTAWASNASFLCGDIFVDQAVSGKVQSDNLTNSRNSSKAKVVADDAHVDVLGSVSLADFQVRVVDLKTIQIAIANEGQGTKADRLVKKQFNDVSHLLKGDISQIDSIDRIGPDSIILKQSDSNRVKSMHVYSISSSGDLVWRAELPIGRSVAPRFEAVSNEGAILVNLTVTKLNGGERWAIFLPEGQKYQKVDLPDLKWVSGSAESSQVSPGSVYVVGRTNHKFNRERLYRVNMKTGKTEVVLVGAPAPKHRNHLGPSSIVTVKPDVFGLEDVGVGSFTFYRVPKNHKAQVIGSIKPDQPIGHANREKGDWSIVQLSSDTFVVIYDYSYITGLYSFRPNLRTAVRKPDLRIVRIGDENISETEIKLLDRIQLSSDPADKRVGPFTVNPNLSQLEVIAFRKNEFLLVGSTSLQIVRKSKKGVFKLSEKFQIEVDPRLVDQESIVVEAVGKDRFRISFSADNLSSGKIYEFAKPAGSSTYQMVKSLEQ